jgi:predicted histone-like DNA-binding protein
MAVLIKAVGMINPVQPQAPMQYYPRAIQSGVVDLEVLTALISASTTLTETDCHAVIISLVKTVTDALEEGKIVRLGQMGSFQISVKGSASPTPEGITAKNVGSASIVFRPGVRFKKMLKNLTFYKNRN